MARDELLDPSPSGDDADHEAALLARAEELSTGTAEAADPTASLRPRSLDEFVGQAELKHRLSV
ncbi:MAG: hypothetical protein ACKO04_04470, partial [Actinomycetes bacterium]